MIGSVQLDDAVRAIERANIVLVCSMRGPAGGRFVYTLLDGHPEAVCYPFKINHVLGDDEVEGLSRPELVARIMRRKRLFDSASNGSDFEGLGPDGKQSIVVDRRTFEATLAALLERLPLTFRNLLLAIAVAHNTATGLRPTGSYFVFYAHELHVAVRYLRAIGTARILAVHRHPINLFASAMRHTRDWSLGNRWQRSAEQAGESVIEAVCRKKVLIPYRPGEFFLNVYRSLEKCDEIDVVLLESLHAEPEQSMRLLADRLGLSWSPTLLAGTIHGLSWGGKGQVKTGGFSPETHRHIRMSVVGQGGWHSIRFIGQNLHMRLGYQDTPARWTDLLSIDRTSIAYYRDLLKLLHEVAFDQSLGVGANDRLRLCGRNLLAAIRYPFVRLGDFALAAAYDRRARVGKLSVINPFVKGRRYFDLEEHAG